MSNSNSGKKALVPAAREALNQFKMEAASDFGVAETTNRKTCPTLQ